MSSILCECVKQPIYSLLKWASKKCSNHPHPSVTEIEEEKIADIVILNQKLEPIPVMPQPRRESIATKSRTDTVVPNAQARVQPLPHRSFEDEILLPAEDTNNKDKHQVEEDAEELLVFRVERSHLGSYYELFSAKVEDLSEKFNLKGTSLPLDHAPGSLEVSFMQSQNVNIFIYSFTLPCSYLFYSAMLNDYDLQKQLDPNIEEYKLQEVISPFAKVNYIAYKKVLIVSPRDFVSLKYVSDCGLQHWEVSISIPGSPVPNKVRGEIVLHATRIKESPNRKHISVKVYSEVNMKLSVRPKLTRNQSLTEIRKYVERCSKYIDENPVS